MAVIEARETCHDFLIFPLNPFPLTPNTSQALGIFQHFNLELQSALTDADIFVATLQDLAKDLLSALLLEMDIILLSSDSLGVQAIVAWFSPSTVSRSAYLAATALAEACFDFFFSKQTYLVGCDFSGALFLEGFADFLNKHEGQVQNDLRTNLLEQALGVNLGLVSRVSDEGMHLTLDDARAL